MKKLLCVGILLGLGAVAWSQTSLGQPRASVDALMRNKLKSSQELLKGLALEDFELITRESQRLRLLSQDVGWNILQTKQYIKHSADFRAAADQLHAAGKAKNLDAAGLGYVKLTLTCIDCHRYVRGARR